MSGSTFVLVHGAFRGPWAWDRVRSILEDDGHRTFAPDLTDPAGTLDSTLATIARPFDEHDLRDVVLVGHSMGGFFARAASQRVAERTSHLVYLDAPVPRHGQSAFDLRPAGTEPPKVERGQVVPPRPLQPGAGVSEDDVAWINSQIVGQPVAPSMDPIELTNPLALALPESYVFFSQTPPWFPCAVTKSELDAAGNSYTLIDAPHDGIVTHPHEIAASIWSATSRH